MKKITLKEVASKAGVSIATVSYVLNDNKNQKISEDTKKRVLEAVEELGFVPNSAAKSLKSQKVNGIGVVIMQNIGRNLVYRKYSRMLVSIGEELKQLGYQMVVCSGDAGFMGMPDFISYYLEQRIGGVIYIADARQELPEEYLKLLDKFGIPRVVVDGARLYENTSNVYVDYYRSTYEFISYLCDHIRMNRILFLHSGDDYLKAREDEQVRAILKVAEEKKAAVLRYGIEGIGLCDRMETAKTFKNTDFFKWRNVLFQIDAALNDWESGDIIICTEGFLAECAYSRAMRFSEPVLFGVLEEFQSIPVVWIDVVSGKSNVIVNSVRSDVIAQHAVEQMDLLMKAGALGNVSLIGKNVDFTKGRFLKN